MGIARYSQYQHARAHALRFITCTLDFGRYARRRYYAANSSNFLGRLQPFMPRNYERRQLRRARRNTAFTMHD